MPSSPLEQASGPICLGHIIESMKTPDLPVNSSGPLRYPPNMPVLPTRQTKLTWEMGKGRGYDVGFETSVPVAPAVGVTLEAGTQNALKRTVKNHWEFDAVDTYIFQPSRTYIEDSCRDREVEGLLRNKKILGLSVWNLWMISGIKIARGASMKREEVRETSTSVSGGAGLTGVAEGKVNVGGSLTRNLSGTYHTASDFVWAVRLTRVSKSLLGSGIKVQPEIRGATFSSNPQELFVAEEVQRMLQDGGLDPPAEAGEIVASEENESFVIQ